MVVLGSNSFVIESTGRNFNVQPFSTELGMENDVPIVDGNLAHNCTFTGKVFVLVIVNALHVPSIGHNLIPTFIIRTGSVIINDVPKIYCEDPAVDDHSIPFDQSDLRISLKLNGVFSHFHTRLPT